MHSQNRKLFSIFITKTIFQPRVCVCVFTSENSTACVLCLNVSNKIAPFSTLSRFHRLLSNSILPHVFMPTRSFAHWRFDSLCAGYSLARRSNDARFTKPPHHNRAGATRHEKDAKRSKRVRELATSLERQACAARLDKQRKNKAGAEKKNRQVHVTPTSPKQGELFITDEWKEAENHREVHIFSCTIFFDCLTEVKQTRPSQW